MSTLTIYPTLRGVQTTPGPIFTALSGQIMLTELGQFSASSVVLPGADRRALLAMKPYTLLEIAQDGATIAYGYVQNPKQSVTANDDHTITLELQPLAAELTWRRTRRGWVAANKMSIVFARLGALVTGWTATFVDAGKVGPDGVPLDLTISVALPNPTVLAGILDTAKQFSQYVRMAVAFDGSPGDPFTHLPVRALEIGQFGAAPTVWLSGANGGEADALATNGLVRIPATIDYEPNTVLDLVNFVVPFGGNSSNTIVTLERLWRIVNDPLYLNYGRYGTDAQSIAHWGGDPTKTSLFPEYDPVHYPISDPENPPTGVTQWALFDTAGNPVGNPGAYGVTVGAYQPNGTFIAGARLPDGSAQTRVTDSGGRIVPLTAVVAQGAVGTRTFTLDGHEDFPVYDAVSYATYGYREGELVDSALTYADNSVANQELTARALYGEAVANFLRIAHARQAFACTVEDASGLPTRAGDLIAVDVQRVSVDDTGAVIELDVVENLTVLSAMRTFQGDAPATDTYTLSSTGRFDETDLTGQVATAKALVAVRLQQGTGLAPYTMCLAGNVDALHPLVMPLPIPVELSRWHSFRVRCDFQPYTATATTAENVAGTPITFGVPHGDHNLKPVAGNAFGAAGIGTTSNPIGGLPDHEHDMDVLLGTGAAPTAADNWLSLSVGGHGGNFLRASKNAPSDFTTGFVHQTSFDLTPTDHIHTAPIQQAVSVATNLTATLPVHTHPLDQRIPDGPLAPNCTMAINGGLLTSGTALTSGTRSADGSFPGSFEVSDVSAFVQTPGQTAILTFTPGTAAGNQYGVGRFQVTIVGFGEFGGLTSTVQAS